MTSTVLCPTSWLIPLYLLLSYIAVSSNFSPESLMSNTELLPAISLVKSMDLIRIDGRYRLHSKIGFGSFGKSNSHVAPIIFDSFMI